MEDENGRQNRVTGDICTVPKRTGNVVDKLEFVKEGNRGSPSKRMKKSKDEFIVIVSRVGLVE